ncbi:hypothetical protein H6758_04570 [Candidatus Nomurabacteria bacterium]|nr:hypothetical protein [Candidatus Nomurabacteria bacterium]
MKTTTLKTLAQISAGIMGGTFFGIAGLIGLMNYGGNHGCWEFINRMTGSVGYESCGMFGDIAGILFGSIFLTLLFYKMNIQRYGKAALWFLLITFVLPVLYGMTLFGSPFVGTEWLIGVSVTLGHMVASIIPAVVALGCTNFISKLLKRVQGTKGTSK